MELFCVTIIEQGIAENVNSHVHEMPFLDKLDKSELTEAIIMYKK